ncbi:MAG: DUF308 domain-containing protein [Anaerofustis stercorihominis]|nr:DUF308 domain-containing protein [Anaerofustis stercorihominis]
MSEDNTKLIEEAVKAVLDINVYDMYDRIDNDSDDMLEQTLLTGGAALIGICTEKGQQNLIADVFEKLICLHTSDESRKEDAQQTMALFAEYLKNMGYITESNGKYSCYDIGGFWDLYIKEYIFISSMISIDEPTLQSMRDSGIDKTQVKSMLRDFRRMHTHLLRLAEALTDVMNEYKGIDLENESMKPTIRVRSVEEAKREDEKEAQEKERLRIWRQSSFYKDTCCVLCYYEGIIDAILKISAKLYLITDEYDEDAGITMFLGFTNNEVASLVNIHKKDKNTVSYKILSAISEGGSTYITQGKYRYRGLTVSEQINDWEKVFITGIYTATAFPATKALDELYHYMLLYTPYLNEYALNGIDKSIYDPSNSLYDIYDVASKPLKNFMVACQMCKEIHELSRSGLNDELIKEEYGYSPADAYEAYARNEEYYTVLDEKLEEEYGTTYFAQPDWFREFYSMVRGIKQDTKVDVDFCKYRSDTGYKSYSATEPTAKPAETTSSYVQENKKSVSEPKETPKEDDLADIKKYESMTFAELISEMKNGSDRNKQKLSATIGKMFRLGILNDNYAVNRFEKLMICTDKNTSPEKVPYDKLLDIYSQANKRKTFLGVLGKNIEDLKESKHVIDKHKEPKQNRALDITIAVATVLLAAFAIFSDKAAFLWTEDAMSKLHAAFVILGAIGGLIVSGVGGIISGAAGFGIGFWVLGYFFDRAGFMKVILGIIAFVFAGSKLVDTSDIEESADSPYGKAKKMFNTKYEQCAEHVQFVYDVTNSSEKMNIILGKSNDKLKKEVQEYYKRAKKETDSMKETMDKIQ